MNQRTIASSPDGITWTSMIPEQIVTMQDIAFGSNRFVAVGDSGKILSSTDGKNWSLIEMAEPTYFLCIAYGNDRFVAMGTGTGMEWQGHLFYISRWPYLDETKTDVFLLCL
jgi:photosystem II stability/assembly factor-like uncharacterized protein